MINIELRVEIKSPEEIQTNSNKVSQNSEVRRGLLKIIVTKVVSTVREKIKENSEV